MERTTREVAELLNVHPWKLSAEIAAGRLNRPRLDTSLTLRWSESDIEAARIALANSQARRRETLVATGA